MSYLKISVITVNYNNLSGLKQTVESYKKLRNLTSNPHVLEYIIIDGASDDGSKEFLNENNIFFDICVSEPDHGIYDAMNKGLDYAQGDFVIFMNSGDCFIPENFFVFAENATTSKIAYAGIAKTKNKTPKKHKISPLIMRLPHHQTILFPVDELKRRRFLWRKYPINADLDHKALFWFSGKMELLDIAVAQPEPPGESLSYNTINDVYKRSLTRYQIAKEHAGLFIAVNSFLVTIMRQSMRLGALKKKSLLDQARRFFQVSSRFI